MAGCFGHGDKTSGLTKCVECVQLSAFHEGLYSVESDKENVDTAQFKHAGVWSV